MTVSGIVLCGQDESHTRYRGRIEKVKFGVPIQDAFHHDIPATLLVLLLKVNKEGPLKKEIWRMPGNQAQARQLQKIMQSGRLVNISNFSVYTACSVIKKFLSKLDGGVFGRENEERLFALIEQDDAEKQREAFCRIVSSMPVPVQHLLVLLFGTFKLIADASAEYSTHMSAEAIGISVAPSLFHTCIHDGQRTARMEDVVRFKIAHEVVTTIIRNFGYSNLFPRENYEFYARITGRTLRLDGNWLFTFQYPASYSSTATVGPSTSTKAEVDDELYALLQRNTEPTSATSRPSQRTSGAEVRRAFSYRLATERASTSANCTTSQQLQLTQALLRRHDPRVTIGTVVPSGSAPLLVNTVPNCAMQSLSGETSRSVHAVDVENKATSCDF